MITIIDYEMGNPKSIMNMLSRLGIKSQLSRNVNDILQANKLILPGVGAFDAAMLNLKKFNLIESLNKKVCRGAGTHIRDLLRYAASD